MLADPAEPGFFGERFLQHRRAVGEGAVAERADACADPVGEFLQTGAHDLVVVTPERVARNHPQFRFVQYRIGRRRSAGQVIHAHGNHA